MSGGKLNWQAWATWTTYAGDRTTTPTPTPPNIHFATGSNPIAAIRSAIEACSAAGGGTVVVGCDYPDSGDAFLLDYQDTDSQRLLISDCHNVVIDFGGATLRQTNFARLVQSDTFPYPPIVAGSGGERLVDDRWVPVGHTMVRFDNCTNIRVENLILDGNRRAANPSSWGTEAPSAAPNCDSSQVADHGIHIVGCSDMVFRNVRVIEAKVDGFNVHFATSGPGVYGHSRRITFEDCAAIRCGRGGFGGDWGHEVKLVRCYGAETGLDFEFGGVTRRAAWAGPADGAHFEAWETETVEKPGHRQLSFEGCTFERNGGRGLVIAGHEFPDGVLVSNCLFDDNGRRTTFQGETRAYSHLEVASSGATVTHCTFRPITTAAGSGLQRPLMFLTVNTVGGEAEGWRKAGHRVIGNRFVGSDEDDESMTYAHRHAIEVYAQSVDGVPLSQDGGTLIEGNHFQRCWGAAYVRAPYTTFRANSVLDGLEIDGSSDQAAVVIAHFARCTRVLGNLFWNTTSRALWVYDGYVVEGAGDCSDLWFCDNVVRYTSEILIHDAAVQLGAACGARVRLVDNLFDRVEATPTKVAVSFVASGSPTLWQGIILRGNVARGAGWTSSGTPTGPWQMSGAPWIEKILEVAGNSPPLPGELSALGGSGVVLGATAADPSSPPDGALWIGVDSPNTGALMFKPTGGAAVNLLAGPGDVSGPGSATDRAIAVFDGTSGALLDDAPATVNTSGQLSLNGAAAHVQLTDGTVNWRMANASGNLVIGSDSGNNEELSLTQDTLNLSNNAGSTTLALTQEAGSTRSALFALSNSGAGGHLSVTTSHGDVRLNAAAAARVDAVGDITLDSGGHVHLDAVSDVIAKPNASESARFQGAGGVTLKAKASGPSTASGEGSIWVLTGTPTRPRFTANGDVVYPLVVGPTGASPVGDNRLARFDDTSGGVLQNSAATLDDSGNLVLENNGAYLRFGGPSSSTYITGTGATGGDLRLAAVDRVILDSVGGIQVNTNQAIGWGGAGASVASVTGSSAGRLTLTATDDVYVTGDSVFVDPVERLHVRDGSYIFAMFDAPGRSLTIGHSTVPAANTKLDIRHTADGIGATVYVENNGSTSIDKRVLSLEFGSDSTVGSGDDWIRFIAAGTEVGNIHSEVVYASFTGSHDGQCPAIGSWPAERDENRRARREVVERETGRVWRPGMLVRSTGALISDSPSRALPAIALTEQAKDPAVMGVYMYARWPHEVRDFDPELPAISYNALGEGKVLVSDLNGPVALGDYLTSSSIAGVAARQDDDLLHSYTVAKCTQAIDWAQVTETVEHHGRLVKVALVGCTYHCG